MVVLTVVATSNDHTIYFDQPIPKPDYIRLLSCLLYNSWYNLASTNGRISLRSPLSSEKKFGKPVCRLW